MIPALRVLAIVLVVTACTAEDPAAEGPAAAVPEAFAILDGSSFSFAYPPSWVTLEETPERVRVAASEDVDAVTATAAMTVDAVYTAGTDGFDTAAAGLRTTLEAFAEDVEIIIEEPLDAPGVEQGVLIESTYVRDGTQVHAFDAYLLSTDGVLHYLRASGPADGDVEALRAITDSVSLS